MNYEIENKFFNNIIVGFDEAGRGPIAGPVVAACVLLENFTNKNSFYEKINDSKKLSKKNRREIYLKLISTHKFGVGVVDNEIIDKINILEASKLAMLIAYNNFTLKYQIFPEIILVDGNFFPFKKMDQIIRIIPIVKGDSKSISIAASSIIAKEFRDDIMLGLDKEFPEYNWKKNSAYPTKSHIENLEKYGITKYHRKTFQPVKSMKINNYL